MVTKTNNMASFIYPSILSLSSCTESKLCQVALITSSQQHPPAPPGRSRGVDRQIWVCFACSESAPGFPTNWTYILASKSDAQSPHLEVSAKGRNFTLSTFQSAKGGNLNTLLCISACQFPAPSNP